MTDWADKKAREWLEQHGGRLDRNVVGLAALLQEVADEREQQFYDALPSNVREFYQKQGREALLAEVRRVVKDTSTYSKDHPDQQPFMAGQRYACEEILRRLPDREGDQVTGTKLVAYVRERASADVAPEKVLASRVERVLTLHREDVGNRCMACGYSWPCQTVRILDGEER